MKTIFVLGRQPAIGTAEIESILGPDAIDLANKHAVMADSDNYKSLMNRLGGTTKLGKLLTFLPYCDWPKIQKYLLESLPEHVNYIPDGKIRLGLSVYGLNISPKQINTTGLLLKKEVKKLDRSVRVVPNKSKELNTAQVLHNQLTGPTGMELLLIADGNRTILAQSVSVQDIDSYAARDQMRPKRDARVGMLPPKLAQIIINLSKPSNQSTILDPFCGTGVILQEAFRIGYNVCGTDIDDRMTEYSEANLTWFSNGVRGPWKIAVGDATTYTWKALGSFDTIAAETYLGRPFASTPDRSTLDKVIQDVDIIHKKFFINVARQTNTGFRMCVAVPAWKTKNGFLHLPVLDSLEKLGYTRQSFVHADNQELIYHRPDQVVGRELVVIVRK